MPVVGGILSEAAESILAGAGLLKGMVGVFGTFAILAMCLVPCALPISLGQPDDRQEGRNDCRVGT